jgi:hypothetical protein
VHSCSPLAVRAPPSAHVPHQVRVLSSIAMADLRDELIRCRRGEDSHITIECHRERSRNIKGCNLERDFESLALAQEAPTARAIRPLALQRALGVYGACTTSPDGGLAAQILAPPIRDVRRDGQPHRISADLHHLHPCCRRR